jgi:death on curing protein
MKPDGELRWVRKHAVLVLHSMSLDIHGGSPGLRDEGLLDSALARPQQIYSYGDPPPDLAALAAAYAVGIARNRPFVDGNKRAALTCLGQMLNKNGYDLVASESETYEMMMALAADTLLEDDLAIWIRQNSEQLT